MIWFEVICHVILYYHTAKYYIFIGCPWPTVIELLFFSPKTSIRTSQILISLLGLQVQSRSRVYK